MPTKILCAVVLLACAVKLSVAQTGCKGRCGSEYYRGDTCQCDYNCLVYGECCEDYESKCTTKNSCKGRCGESFKRGRLCSCDSDCMKYKQCCPDYKANCDAEEIRGAASATKPVKTSSCDNVNDSKPKEPTLTEATKQPSLSEENNADDYIIPLDSPTSYPPDDLTDDTYNQNLPGDEFYNNGPEDPEASPVPESSSGYDGLPTTDPLDQAPTEPTLGADTLEFTTESVYSQTEVIPSDDDNLITLSPTVEEPVTDANNLTEPSAQGTILPVPTIPADYVSSLSTSASTTIPEITTFVVASDEPEVSAVDMPDSDTMPASVLASTATPEEITSNSNTESKSEDTTTNAPSTASSTTTTTSELDASTINNSSSTAVVQDDTKDYDTPELTTADPRNDTLKLTSPAAPAPTSKPQDKPDPGKLGSDSKPETKPVDPQTQNVDDPRDYQGDDSNDTNLCSGRPVSGATTLRNGTIVVFRGHYFWLLDSNRVPSAPQGITAVWGIPSPIDTVFTRCNCQGKTYIFKGGRYWRFENDVLDSGYPKVIKAGFDGLQGHITAALSVPQYRSRRESVYFFKRGGSVQKYSYQFGTSPTCGRKVNYSIYTVRSRTARQAVSVLEPAINIRTSWRGFPSTITAAVSVPSNAEPDGYKYYVFSRSKSYNVRLNGDRPVITAPRGNASPQTNSLFRCPMKS